MDIQPTSNQQPISDDQELAKVLAGVNQQANEATTQPSLEELQQAAQQQSQDMAQPVDTPPVSTDDATTAPQDPAIATPAPMPQSAAYGDLDSIKQEALGELRPLVDKLDVSPEEKFDTYLLLLRSTDDRDLIAPAHEAARNIVDEARRAQALLDIIKEIDFLAGNNQQATQ